MSSYFAIEAHDTQLVEKILNRVNPSHADSVSKASLLEILSQCKLTSFHLKSQQQKKNELKRLRELNAPELVLSDVEAQIDPIHFCIEALNRGSSPKEIPFSHLTKRAKIELNRNQKEAWTILGWVADGEGRQMERERGHWFQICDPEVLRLMYGRATHPFGIEDRKCAHYPKQIPEIILFLENIIKSGIPRFSDFQRWAAGLDLQLYLNEDDQPNLLSQGELEWRYILHLKAAHQLASQLLRFNSTCKRRGWTVLIFSE